jgi:hypothetical protein
MCYVIIFCISLLKIMCFYETYVGLNVLFYGAWFRIKCTFFMKLNVWYFMKFYCHISFIVRLSKYCVLLRSFMKFCTKFTILEELLLLAPLLLKKWGSRGGFEFTPSLRLSVSNPTPFCCYTIIISHNLWDKYSTYTQFEIIPGAQLLLVPLGLVDPITVKTDEMPLRISEIYRGATNSYVLDPL